MHGATRRADRPRGDVLPPVRWLLELFDRKQVKATFFILGEIAEEHAGKVKIVKVNVDENPQLARDFDVMSIPTLIVFKDGEPKRRMIGAKGKTQLLEELAEFL